MRPALYTIAPHLPFLNALVAGIMAETGGDALSISRMTVLLPTRRAARSMREAFLRASEGRALLLPRVLAAGDLEDDALGLSGEESVGFAAGTEIPPAIPELRRRLLLTRLVLEWGRRRGTAPLLPGQAAMLSRELARFLDDVQSEGRDMAALATLAPAEYAEHWQLVLQFLGIITEHWPQIVIQESCLDPVDRRNAVLAAQAEAWRRDRPSQRIIAAGLTGTTPAVAELLQVIAFLPGGAVVLPGLARDSDPEDWAAIAEDSTHPQHQMAQLLARFEASPADVRVWPAPGLADASPARTLLAAEILRPAAATHRWRGMAPLDPAALRGLQRLDCAGPHEEAVAIALLLRQRLESPGETAALVTPDRDLARRVAGELRRWGIEIDDSAGTPLNRTPPGVFLRLVADLAASELAPVPLLATLKHPLAGAGWPTEVLRDMIRRLEREVLRGPRPAPGFAGLTAALATAAPELTELVERLKRALAPLVEALDAPETTLTVLVAAHAGAAEALASTDAESGAVRLWRGDAGETAARFLAELMSAAGDFPPLRGADYPALFESLLAGPVVRPNYGRHPRLAIWGLMEARLQHAHLMILGGLNEGTWPADAASDPWLSRPMRRDLGLSPPERQVGVAAHDFAQALCAGEVVLTRAVRVEGTPTVPSRWLLRLDTVLRAAEIEPETLWSQTFLAWQAELDRPSQRHELQPPAPRPPVSLRPRRLSVTEIETWMRDPYAIYARHVLKLRALDPLDADPGAAERGQIIHESLDRFVREYPATLPADAEAQLLAIGRETFGPALSRPGIWAFWWPRFERIARWFVTIEGKRRLAITACRAELEGRLPLNAPAGRFELVCRADRIDCRQDGELVIIDYKTGAVPKRGDVELGFSPQLPLEAAIAEAGGFAGLPAGTVAELSHWRLSGDELAGEVKVLAEDSAAVRVFIDDAVAGLRGLVAEFDRPETPYRARPRPDHAPRFSDYAHLARVKEWSVGGGDE
jgi:ATP-dependent helicase/nuclease subunit B